MQAEYLYSKQKISTIELNSIRNSVCANEVLALPMSLYKGKYCISTESRKYNRAAKSVQFLAKQIGVVEMYDCDFSIGTAHFQNVFVPAATMYNSLPEKTKLSTFQSVLSTFAHSKTTTTVQSKTLCSAPNSTSIASTTVNSTQYKNKVSPPHIIPSSSSTQPCIVIDTSSNSTTASSALNLTPPLVDMNFLDRLLRQRQHRQQVQSRLDNPDDITVCSSETGDSSERSDVISPNSSGLMSPLSVQSEIEYGIEYGSVNAYHHQGVGVGEGEGGDASSDDGEYVTVSPV
jgi:hypothetical protein